MKKDYKVPIIATIVAVIMGLVIMLVLAKPAKAVQWLKQSTQVTVRIGPLLDFNDAITPEVDFDVSTSDECELLKGVAGAATVSMSGVALADIADVNGWYNLVLTTSHTDTLGPLTYVLQDDSIILPYFKEFIVVDANLYNSFFSTGELDIYSVRGAAPLNKGTIADEVQIHMDANSLLNNGTFGLSAIKGYVDDIGVAGAGLTALPELVFEDANAPSASDITAILADTNELQTDWVNGGRLDNILDGVSTTYLLDTTVATPSSTTRFTLTGGKQSNNAFINHVIAVTDADDSNIEERLIIGYTSGRVVTVDRPFTFTPAALDVARISLGGYTYPKKGVR